MNKLEEISAHLEDMGVSAKTADGFDNAIIGVANDFNSKPRVVYSVTECINILMERDGMTYLDAMEYFSYNVEGAYVGETTPIWVDDMMFEVIRGEL